MPEQKKVTDSAHSAFNLRTEVRQGFLLSLVLKNRKGALLDFKDIVKDFLFEHKGFFELSGDRLIFKRSKEK